MLLSVHSYFKLTIPSVCIAVHALNAGGAHDVLFSAPKVNCTGMEEVGCCARKQCQFQEQLLLREEAWIAGQIGSPEHDGLAGSSCVWFITVERAWVFVC